MGDIGDKALPVTAPLVEHGSKSQRHWIMGDDSFNAKAIHHQGIKELWEKKWKFPVRLYAKSEQEQLTINA